MKTWMRFGLGAAALLVAVAIGTAAYAMRDDDDGKPGTVAEERDTTDGGASGACLEGSTECDDIPGEASDGLNQTCMVGTPDCVDADLGGDGADVASICIEGATDCNDTPGVPYGDFGEVPARCAADAVDCVEPMPAPDCVFIEGPTPEESGVSCPNVDCDSGPGGPDELVDPPMGAPGAQETQAGEPGTTSGCLGVDPCTISSQQMCPPDDCAVSSDGTTTCYAIDPVCEAPADANEPAVCEDTAPPSQGGGSPGNPGSTEPGATQ